MRAELVTTNSQNLFTWATGNSLWTFGLNLSCCGLEFTAAISPRYDWDRFGSMVQTEPKNADLLIIAGPITKALSEQIIQIYAEMLSPKYVISMGSCANTGGMFASDSYTVINGVDKILPVDVYVPGCPPRPEALIHGLLTLQKKIQRSQAAQ